MALGCLPAGPRLPRDPRTLPLRRHKHHTPLQKHRIRQVGALIPDGQGGWASTDNTSGLRYRAQMYDAATGTLYLRKGERLTSQSDIASGFAAETAKGGIAGIQALASAVPP